eukprot:TRINITY_DN5379_c0_g1_i13.p6 TRINITY_DN5379_c0_g1~~TRINITY_DN5379_c0_g1_i13.p6  ORF type:complete len:144 (-),score=11.69 TRINITY_DN5379_c0_g1_i13:1200-1631(-)
MPKQTNNPVKRGQSATSTPIQSGESKQEIKTFDGPQTQQAEQDRRKQEILVLEQQLGLLLTNLAELKSERKDLQLKVSALEKALLSEISAAKESIDFMNATYTQLENAYSKLSQWNTMLTLGAAALGIVCMYLTQRNKSGSSL